MRALASSRAQQRQGTWASAIRARARSRCDAALFCCCSLPTSLWVVRPVLGKGSTHRVTAASVGFTRPQPACDGLTGECAKSTRRERACNLGNTRGGFAKCAVVRRAIQFAVRPFWPAYPPRLHRCNPTGGFDGRVRRHAEGMMRALFCFCSMERRRASALQRDGRPIRHAARCRCIAKRVR